MLRCIQALCGNPLCCVWFVALHCVAIRCVTVVLYLLSCVVLRCLVLCCVVEMFSISSIPSMLRTGQIKASTSPPRAYPGHLTVILVWGGGNLNVALKGWGI